MTELTPQRRSGLATSGTGGIRTTRTRSRRGRAIPLRKRIVNRVNRHAAAIPLRQPAETLDQLEAVDNKAKARRRQRWQKSPDIPLSEYLRRQAARGNRSEESPGRHVEGLRIEGAVLPRERSGNRLRGPTRSGRHCASSLICLVTGSQGAQWWGSKRACVVFLALYPPDADRREMSEGMSAQTRTTCRMPPHQPSSDCKASGVD